MTLKRSCIPIELADEEERLNVLLHKAFEEISDEEYERIGRDAFFDNFISKNASPAYQAYLKKEEHYTDEGEYIP